MHNFIINIICNRLDYQTSDETKTLHEHVSSLSEENKDLKDKLAVVQKEKSAVEKRLTQQISK